MKHTKCYIKDYPRPQFVRKDWINLNGEWDFVFDYENRGEKDKYYTRFPVSKKINVPFSYQTEKSGIAEQKRCDNIWYRKTVDFSSSQIKSKAVLLNFEACDYICKVWVNGIFVGMHKGGYTRFSFDISNSVKTGKNIITVKAEDSYNTNQPRGKQRWRDENFACWYEDTNGLWKTVWCEFVAKSYLKSVSIVPEFKDNKVSFCFSIENFNADLSVQTIVSFNDLVVSDTEVKLLKNNLKMSVDLRGDTDIFKVSHWYWFAPNLYDVKFILKQNGKQTDEVGSYFGMREYQINGNNINLNNIQLYLKMLLDQGYWKESHLTPPDEDAIIKDIQLTKDMGYNGIRKHQKIEDERFYYYCDIMGVVVWCEMPSAYEFSEEMKECFIYEWTDVVRQYKNHPCIMAWVPFNESWGIFRVLQNREEQRLTESLYYITKALDEQERPVISNDGWEHTKSDIITLHNYVEWGKDMEAAYLKKDEVLSDQYLGGANVPRPAFANGYKYEGQPVIISEYGGIAFSKDKDKGWGYGNLVDNTEVFLKRLDSLTTSIKKIDYVCGYCLTQTTDVMQEVNGLLTMDRIPKADVNKIKDINK